MRIGIDARLWNETGVGRYIRMLYKYLPKEQEIIWFFGTKEFDLLTMPKNWKKVRCDIHWHTLTEQLVLPFIFLRANLDLLHFPYFTFPILYPKKFVVTIHDMIYDHYKTGRGSTLPLPLFWLKKLGYKLVNFVSVRRASAVFTLSNDAKKEIVAHYKADPTKIYAIYEAGGLENTSTSSLSPTEKPYLLYVGNAHPHKNVETLIMAAEILKMKLVLVGNDKFFYPRLPKSKYVKVVGEVPNTQIANWFRHAAALVSASKMEGFGIPPLEAMSMGCPVIISDIPVFHEINGSAAEYFDHTDPGKIAMKIKTVLADKKRLGEMVVLGYKQAAKYSWIKMVKQTRKIYEGCLSL